MTVKCHRTMKLKEKQHVLMGSLHETRVHQKVEVSMAVSGVCLLSQVTEIHAVTAD